MAGDFEVAFKLLLLGRHDGITEIRLLDEDDVLAITLQNTAGGGMATVLERHDIYSF